jgi:hypothetical protein
VTTIAEVRTDLERVLELISPWRATGYVGDQINPPQFVVTRQEFDPRLVLQGSKAQHTFRVIAYMPRVTPVESEAALDALAEPTGNGSLIETVQTSTNWTVTVDYAQVTQVGEVSAVQFGTDTAEYLACPFTIEVVW